MLALLVLIVVARRVTRLHTLRILACIRQSEELLLKLGRYINAGKVCGLCSYSNFLSSLVAEEYALLCGIGGVGWMNA